MSLKWELDYHQKHIDEAKVKENEAFHKMLKLIASLGGTREHEKTAISIWVDGCMASSDEGWHKAFRSEVNDKIEELRSLIDIEDDAELLK